jgi:hypothetical protein
MNKRIRKAPYTSVLKVGTWLGFSEAIRIQDKWAWQGDEMMMMMS